jgi:hypothetical protein
LLGSTRRAERMQASPERRLQADRAGPAPSGSSTRRPAMSRSFDTFRMGANGVDPDRGTGRADPTRARTDQPAEPPTEDDRERARYHQGMYGMGDTRELSGFPHSNYGNTGANEPYPPSRMNPDVWRGRNEDYDFWGRERHEAYHGAHPSLWQRVKGAFSGKGPKNYTRSDERIREDVCEHLTHHPYVDASDIEVTVRDGEVTLSGTVDARIVKRAAEEVCDHVCGVTDVHNHLRVRPPQEAGTSAGTGPGRP